QRIRFSAGRRATLDYLSPVPRRLDSRAPRSMAGVPTDDRYQRKTRQIMSASATTLPATKAESGTAQGLTVYVETYGCQMNVSDSELMIGKLAASGYTPVNAPEGADVILVNTCAIRDHAEQRVIGRLGELRRHMKPGSVIGVTGCMAQRLGPQLLENARHVSLVIGPD